MDQRFDHSGGRNRTKGKKRKETLSGVETRTHIILNIEPHASTRGIRLSVYWLDCTTYVQRHARKIKNSNSDSQSPNINFFTTKIKIEWSHYQLGRDIMYSTVSMRHHFSRASSLHSAVGVEMPCRTRSDCGWERPARIAAPPSILKKKSWTHFFPIVVKRAERHRSQLRVLLLRKWRHIKGSRFKSAIESELAGLGLEFGNQNLDTVEKT